MGEIKRRVLSKLEVMVYILKLHQTRNLNKTAPYYLFRQKIPADGSQMPGFILRIKLRYVNK